ncbi:hypothetical protein [Helicobacter cetorum]|uniref:hypothetical protein n=1 Tax=Helicobacter cetorum TaxID=138563 RepID=UPI000CF08D20|nr:hypothetical protein [Helicobacter cetorum]
MFFDNPLNNPNYFQPNNAPKNFGLSSLNNTSYSDFLNAPPKAKNTRFSSFLDNVGGFGGLGMIGGAIGGIGSLITGAINASEQNKNAKESMQMAREQFRLENERYNAREQERLNNNKAVNEIAKGYDIKSPNENVMTRF